MRRKLKHDVRFRPLLELLEDWRTLVCMLALVVAGIVTALWEVCWPDAVPWNAHDPGVFAFEVAVTAVRRARARAARVCFAHAARCSSPTSAATRSRMDMFVVGADVAMMGIALFDMLSRTAGGSPISPGFHRVLRSQAAQAEPHGALGGGA